MGVDAEMVVRLLEPITDEQLVDASYRLAEACPETFWLSGDDDLAEGDIRRAMNRIGPDADDYACRGVAERDGRWLSVSLWGRYYGPGYERGHLWSYIAVAEWLERNFPGCVVFYGGDYGESLAPFSAATRGDLIAHWALHGGRPYYAGEGKTRGMGHPPHPLRPTCPLCQQPATQYGSGGLFASWTCDGCGRHWVWVGGETVKAFPASQHFDSFKAAAEMRAAQEKV